MDSPWKVTQEKHNDNANQDAGKVDLIMRAAVPV